MSGQIETWQQRLADEGRVRFRQSPWLPVLMVVLGTILSLGPLGAIVAEGPSAASLVPLLFFLFAVGFGIYQLVTGRPGFTVTREGVTVGRRLAPFDAVAAVRVQRVVLYLDHRPLPGQRLVGPQRTTGLKTLPVMLRGTGVRGADLATWLLQVKGGPDARIDIRPGGRLGDIYTLAHDPWWEQPPGT